MGAAVIQGNMKFLHWQCYIYNTKTYTTSSVGVFCSSDCSTYGCYIRVTALLEYVAAGPHLTSWVDWSNFSCSRKQQQH